jgi:hypothetical protein
MPRNSVAYDDDFYAWTQEQARLLRAGELAEVDHENAAEELEDMGRSLRNELRNRLAVLVMHLLKWQHQPLLQSRSWSSTIREQRQEIADLLDESPSLRSALHDLSRVYARARTKAATETGFPETMFAAECPYTPEQILNEDFLPEG